MILRCCAKNATKKVLGSTSQCTSCQDILRTTSSPVIQLFSSLRTESARTAQRAIAATDEGALTTRRHEPVHLEEN